jgi:hypothetical protein
LNSDERETRPTDVSFIEWVMALVDALFEKYGITPKERGEEKR